MTTLFRPVLIESAEQAEALPSGTIFWTQRPSGFRYDYGTVGKFGVTLASDWTDEPYTLHALVPIEAEEEILHQDTFATSAQLRRYTTPWQRFTAPKEAP